MESRTESPDHVWVVLFPPLGSTNAGDVAKNMHMFHCPKKQYKKHLSQLLTGVDRQHKFTPQDDHKLAMLRAPWFQRPKDQREHHPFLLPEPYDRMVTFVRLDNQQSCEENQFSNVVWLNSTSQGKGGGVVALLMDEEGFFADMTEDLAEKIVLSYAKCSSEWQKNFRAQAPRSVFDEINTRTTPLRPSQVERLDLALACFPDSSV